MILGKNCHDFFGFGGLCEGRKAAQIAKDNRHLATVALQERVSIARRNDEVGDLLGQEPPEPRHPLELRHLVGHGLLERAIPVGKLRGLVLKALGLAGDSVVKRLLAQHRAHPRE